MAVKWAGISLLLITKIHVAHNTHLLLNDDFKCGNFACNGELLYLYIDTCVFLQGSLN